VTKHVSGSCLQFLSLFGAQTSYQSTKSWSFHLLTVSCTLGLCIVQGIWVKVAKCSSFQSGLEFIGSRFKIVELFWGPQRQPQIRGSPVILRKQGIFLASSSSCCVFLINLLIRFQTFLIKLAK